MPMKLSIIAFDDYTDIDVFLMWDLLKRVHAPVHWDVQILGTKPSHTSKTGIPIPMHGSLELANASDAVLFASGPGTYRLIKDESFLRTFQLNPGKQLIGSMCSGALILAALGFLKDKPATTYPTAKALLAEYGVHVVEEPFVVSGNVATAAGCLAAQHLVGWVIERFAGEEERKRVLTSIQPVGEGLSFS